MAKTKKRFLLLAMIYLSFLALGMPDGALGVAWPSMRYEMGLPLAQAQVIFMTQSFFYALTGALVGRIAKVFKLEHLNIAGILLMAAALFGFSLSPNLLALAAMAMFLGIGMAFIDTSLNAFTAKHFSSRHMNWLHCFWGMGATISPIVMSQAILLLHWRAGYVSLAVLQGIAALLVLFSLVRGVWRLDEAAQGEKLTGPKTPAKFLTKKHFQYLQMLIFFVYTGFEYSITFWTPSVMLESRGLDIAVAGLYPAVYLGSIMGGRMLFGLVADRLSNITMIRLGFCLAFAGLGVLIFSNNILGMALTGLGFAPVFPSLMHETSKRFHPSILTKLVGYQIAAVGAGMATLSALIGQVLSRVSLEALFPLVLALVICAFVINEIIERGVSKA